MNRLANTTSPYLRQHADNPVDWYPWGDDAFTAARERDTPIFLSVGYATCHWCHVMAHESFEDDEVAEILNDGFVCVKVDREERPDVDAVYMRALQSLTGHGGWPMSVFLTPEGEPFYAGTYWPRQPRHGMPDFPRVLGAIGEAWQQRRDEVTSSASSIAETLASHREFDPAGALDTGIVDEAASSLLSAAWDREHGGFGRAPKFPQAMTIEWLLHHHLRTGSSDAFDAAAQALDAMARGGINDLIAGGFARYATDERWLVPHFEKMVYDNALLLPVYAQAAAITGDVTFARVAGETAGALLGELRRDDGSFVSAVDADSEGVEGKFYVWSYDELADVIADAGGDVERWTTFLGATAQGNWEGVNILHEPVPRERFAAERGIDPATFDDEWTEIRAALRRHRAERVPPGVDDKVLTEVNALAVRGLVIAGGLLGEDDWIAAGSQAADALHRRHVRDGRLLHTSPQGAGAVDGFLEDHAYLALADLELYSATGEAVWFERAQALAIDADARFHDDEDGGWFQTASDAERLYTRPKDLWDNAVPAGTSVMAEVCRVLGGLTGESHWWARAEEAMRLFQDGARRSPAGYGWVLRQFEALAAGPREVAVVGAAGPARDALAGVVNERVRPGVTSVVTGADHGDRPPLLAARGEVDGQPAAYVCRELTCQRPVTTPEELRELLDG